MKNIIEVNSPSPKKTEILPHEFEIIQMAVDFGRIIGLPRSVCEIYGLLISAIEPIAMESICLKLGMSLGSVSQGLKLLRELGAVRTISQTGQRRDFYQAEFNFRKIVTRYLSEKIGPTLNSAESRFQHIEALVSELPEKNKSDITRRVELIRKLNRRASQVVPAVSKILSL